MSHRPRQQFLGMLAAMICLSAGAVPTPAQALEFSTVVIDAGHGGHDSGCAHYGLLEKKLCLDVAKRLETALKKRNLRVVMTRRTDRFVPLGERAKISNRYSKAIFVSIHFNATRKRNISGMEVYYRSAKGKVLARSILRSMDRRLVGNNRGLIHGNMKVLRATEMPAVLLEPAYLSNRTEARRYANAENRQKLAEAIASGIAAARG